MLIRRGALRTGWPWPASALVVLVTATVVVVTNTRDGRLVTPTGRFVSTTYDVRAPVSSYQVTLPIGVLTLGVTEARSNVDDSDDLDGRRPPEDGSFIGVTTQLRQTFTTPATADAAQDTAPTPIGITVIADGRRYPVRTATVDRSAYAPPAGARLHGYLAVAGSPRDITVEVGFDGERQTVNPRTTQRTPGRFAELNPSTTTFTERDCPAPALPAGYRATSVGGPPSCIVENAVRTPWIAGLGWAPPGQSWQAVAVYLGTNLDVERTATTVEYYSTPYGNRIAMTLAGQASKGSLTDNQAPPERRTGTVTGFFLVPRGSGPAPVQVSMTFPHLVRSSESPATAPLDPSVVVTWKVSVS